MRWKSNRGEKKSEENLFLELFGKTSPSRRIMILKRKGRDVNRGEVPKIREILEKIPTHALPSFARAWGIPQGGWRGTTIEEKRIRHEGFYLPRSGPA